MAKKSVSQFSRRQGQWKTPIEWPASCTLNGEEHRQKRRKKEWGPLRSFTLVNGGIVLILGPLFSQIVVRVRSLYCLIPFTMR